MSTLSTTNLKNPDAVGSNIILNADGSSSLNSPVLTGTPTAPTAANGTNTTQIATTAFVLANLSGGGGASLQVFTSSGTFTPTAGKSSFLVFCTGGGGGSGQAQATSSGPSGSGGGGGGGTAVRLYTLEEMGASAVVTIGGGGAAQANGGSSTFDPAGTGLTITGGGGSKSSNSGGAAATVGGAGGTTTNSMLPINGSRGETGDHYGAINGPSVHGGVSFWAGGPGVGGQGASKYGTGTMAGNAGSAGAVFILEF